jgi:hypothetical protein
MPTWPSRWKTTGSPPRTVGLPADVPTWGGQQPLPTTAAEAKVLLLVPDALAILLQLLNACQATPAGTACTDGLGIFPRAAPVQHVLGLCLHRHRHDVSMSVGWICAAWNCWWAGVIGLQVQNTGLLSQARKVSQVTMCIVDKLHDGYSIVRS